MRSPFKVNALRRWMRQFATDRSGVAAIELAAVAGPLVIGLVIGADMAMSIHTRNRINSAAQAGAQYAVINGFDAAKIKDAVTNATSLTGMSIEDPLKFCGCPTQTTIMTATCGSNCSGGGTAANYTTIVVSKVYSPMFSFNQAAGTNGQTLRATTTVRLP